MTHRILIVDDEPNTRNALAALLRDEGFDIETAANGNAATAKLETFDAHVVLLELHMRGEDGVELVAELQRRAAPPAVLVITTFGDTAHAIEALRAGALDYVTKPIHVSELLVVLDKAIEHHDLEQEVGQLRRSMQPGGSHDYKHQGPNHPRPPRTPELDEVAAAIRRLGDGSYGRCTSCGDRIEPDRLAALPEAAECVDCATYGDEPPVLTVFALAAR
jgi:DNA-binding NtrC family response regulator